MSVRTATPREPARDAGRAPLLRLEQVAEHLQVGLGTIKAWRASGRLRVLAFGRGCARVEPAEVERLKREART